jgi:transcription termination factor Rho
MIRNTMLGLSLLALTTGSALAATPASKHVSKPRTVAAAPAGDAAKADAPKADAPKTDAPKTDAPKKEKKGHKAPKGDATKTEGAKEMKAPAPAPETK